MVPAVRPDLGPGSDMIERVSLDPPHPVAEIPFYERRCGWVPHGGQRRIIEAARVRNRLVSAGRRFGKSEVGGHKLVQEAINTRLVRKMLDDLDKRREFWIVGPSYTESEKEFRVMWNRLSRLGLRDHFDKPGSYNNPQIGQMNLSLWGGRFIVSAMSEKHPDSLVGEGVSGVVLAEAAKLKQLTWTKRVRPTLADYRGWSLFISSPEGKNWFYDLWKRGQDPGRPDWWSMRAPSWLNPHVYPGGASDDAILLLRRAIANRTALTEIYARHGIGDDVPIEIGPALFDALGIDPEIGELAADLTPETFAQEIGADFTEFTGRVFKGFDEELHVGDFDYDPTWTTYACSDAGFTNPAVWLLLQIDPHGERIRVLDEVYEAGLRDEEFAALVAARGLAPADTRRIYPDPADPAFARTLSEKLKIPLGHNTGGELKTRLDLIRDWLKERNPHLPHGHPDRFPMLAFDRKCVHTINDFLNYRYPERKEDAKGNPPELPMKKDDHGPEALGRFFAGHFGKETRRRARAGRSNLAGARR